MDSQVEKEMRKSRNKIKKALTDAKERVKRKCEDDIAISFQRLQVHTIELLETLKKIGCEVNYDWVTLIEKACDMMEPLCNAAPFMVSVDEHAIRKADLIDRQSTLKNVTRVMARKLLCEGKHDQSVQAALFSLRFSIDVHGLDSVQLVPAYLILSESSIGLGNLQQADEYLAHAEWTVMKSDDTTNAVKSKLFRRIGVLFAARGNYEASLRLFAEDVYHGSLEWGSGDIKTTGGYFHMANVFFRQNKMDIADSLYNQVNDNWFKYLVPSIKKMQAQAAEVSYLEKPKDTCKQQRYFLDEDLESEALQILNAIYDIRENAAKSLHEQLATVCFNLCMFHYLVNDQEQSLDYYEKGKIVAAAVPGGYHRIVPKLFDFHVERRLSIDSDDDV